MKKSGSFSFKAGRVLFAAACGAMIMSTAASGAEAASSDTLVVYFSRVGNTDFDENVDVVSSASLIASDSGIKGNAQQIAEWIADEASADIFEVQTVDTYPTDYDETVNLASAEQQDNARPELSSALDGTEGYKTVYIVFPNWWGDLPMAFYTFFDTYDFAGVKMPVFVTHGGSGFSNTISTIGELEPDAEVVQGLSISGGSVADSEEEIRNWVKDNQ